ncbi:ComF family protein [Candidatus Chlorohelix sp.]|uniref:ComF family protein n=1 Tax=Candidatus Chlorohelix sp. TaxID=3139201 RepID=UPI00302A0E15
MKLTGILVDFFFPPRCFVCGKIGQWLHPDCRKSLPYITQSYCLVCGAPFNGVRCYSPLCSMPSRSLDTAGSVFIHIGAIRQAVLKLKYRGVRAVSGVLGAEMAEAIKQRGWLDSDLLIPVPLHRTHLQERGYNQAGLLAESISEVCKLEIDEIQLARIRQTRSQIGLGLRERAENVANAFEWRGASLIGKNILLVDDVCTTGATLNACATVLKAAGANLVRAITLTRE